MLLIQLFRVVFPRALANARLLHLLPVAAAARSAPGRRSDTAVARTDPRASARDRPRAGRTGRGPGGEACFARSALRAAWTPGALPETHGKPLVSVIGNGEDLSSTPNRAMVDWMVARSQTPKLTQKYTSPALRNNTGLCPLYDSGVQYDLVFPSSVQNRSVLIDHSTYRHTNRSRRPSLSTSRTRRRRPLRGPRSSEPFLSEET